MNRTEIGGVILCKYE